MPSRPPDTKFYEDEQNATLWRDVSRLYEDFLGSEEAQWGQLQLRFERVLNDILLKLSPFPCSLCGTSLENVAEDTGTILQCPGCGWKPVTVT